MTAAERAKHLLDAKLALDDSNVFESPKLPAPIFGSYADRWLKEHCGTVIKMSTRYGHEEISPQL